MRRTGTALILTVLMVLASAFPVLAQTGWVRSGESWNYYKSDGTMASNQWIKSGDVLFWIQEDGTMAVNTWLESGDKKYWLDGSGAAVTGAGLDGIMPGRVAVTPSSGSPRASVTSHVPHP